MAGYKSPLLIRGRRFIRVSGSVSCRGIPRRVNSARIKRATDVQQTYRKTIMHDGASKTPHPEHEVLGNPSVTRAVCSSSDLSDPPSNAPRLQSGNEIINLPNFNCARTRNAAGNDYKFRTLRYVIKCFRED